MIEAYGEKYLSIFTDHQNSMKDLAWVVVGVSVFSVIFYAISKMSLKELNRKIEINNNRESLAIKIAFVAFAILLVTALFISIPKDLAILSFALFGFVPRTIARIVYREN